MVQRLRRHGVETVVLVVAYVVLSWGGAVTGSLLASLAWSLSGVVAVLVAFTRWPEPTSGPELWLRSTVHTLGFLLVTAPSGWWPVLVSLQLLAVVDSVRHAGPRAVRPVLVTAAAWTVAAQAGALVGVVPSRIDGLAAPALATVSFGLVTVVARRIARLTSDREDARAEARDNEALFRTLMQASNDVVLVVRDGVVVQQIPERSSLGHRAADVVGRRYTDLIHPDDCEQVVATVVDMLSHHGTSGMIEARFAHPDGRWVPLELSCRNLSEDPIVRGFVVNARDVSERHHLKGELEYRAFHDVLTGLANRSLLLERVDRILTMGSRTPHPFALLYLDVDGFKSINDSLGHEAGDHVLIEVAARISEVLRDNDTAARLGGDEFALLLDGLTSAADAARVAGRVLEVLTEPLLIAGRSLAINGSIGIVTHGDGSSAEELLRNADIAMYMAKRGGKGRFEVFEPEMHADAVERLQLENDLSHALDRHELVLHYQPVVSLDDGNIVGVEALLRWDHPERGRVNPADFIPLAESTGHIVPIGRWVLLEACRRVAAWQRRYPAQSPLDVAVNVSMVQLTHGDVIRDVKDALAVSGLQPECLTIELTETAVAEHREAIVDLLVRLRELGVRVAIDDFGTGYSSLQYLQQFPVDVLKIDRSFVGGLVAGRQHPGVVQAIVELGHRLELQTIAEGIEQASELDQFRDLQCQLGQGYLFARPDDGDVVEQLLAKRPDAPPETTVQPRRGTHDAAPELLG